MIERRTVEELAALYELEPHLADVYVEGPRDRAFVEWLANEAGLQRVAAYEIDTVNVPGNLVAAHGGLSGNRGRVVALACELSRLARVSLIDRVAGLVDADLDYFDGPPPSAELLILTDYPAIEVYLFCPPVMDKFLRLVLGKSSVEAQVVLDRISSVLRELFMIRVAARKLKVSLGLVDFSGSCSVKDGVVTFDRAHYVGRYIRRDGFAGSHDEFLTAVTHLHTAAIADVRFVVHGHDFIEVLAWYSREVLRAKALYKPEECGRALRGCLEFVHMVNSTLVRELSARFGGNSAAVESGGLAPATA